MSKSITGQINISSFSQIEKRIKNISDLKKNIEKKMKKNITEFLEILTAGAIVLDVSDIHIEPKKEKIKIRVRLDGILQPVIEIEKEKYKRILSRIKLLSGIKLNISKSPQDGRFSIIIQEQSIETRVSSLPTEYGESLVLRILNPENLINIEDLGLRKDLLKIFQREIKKPNGMIIVTGPTGSGKTTTLYTILKEIQSPQIKIITIEDPIEYHLKGISQTQIDSKKGYDFANGLEAIMRQDPDVILVGEIRNKKTAKIAIQAALTGHLVLSTLHTNDAAGTIARLVTMEAKTSNIGPALNISIAQRLVRKICKKCYQLDKPSSEETEKIKQGLKNIPDKLKKELKIKENVLIPKPKGCEHCNQTGYKGRTGIYEFVLMDDEMEKFILENPSIAAIKEEARKRGMINMYHDGLIKVLQGITDFEELKRVTGI